ncbi:hypothetical protein LINGRAHAP2_LOCUS10535 [Linum grandiflorum]
MQQRQTTSSKAPSTHHQYHTINVPDEDLNQHRQRIASSYSSYCSIHLIPLLVLFCLFLLWWFSRGVSLEISLEIKDGEKAGIHPIDFEEIRFKGNMVELAVWEIAAPQGSLPSNITPY